MVFLICSYSPDGSVPLHDYFIKNKRFFVFFPHCAISISILRSIKVLQILDFPAWTHHSLWNFLKQNLDLGYKLRKLYKLLLIHR
jgi:hypothetical protein